MGYASILGIEWSIKISQGYIGDEVDGLNALHKPTFFPGFHDSLRVPGFT